MEKLRISCPIIVEGKYDREKLLSVCEATVLTTDGFGIFKKPEKQALFLRLSEKSRLIILSDSDGAGSAILYLKRFISSSELKLLFFAPWVHFLMHSPQSMQRSESISAQPPRTRMASVGQCFMQVVQPVHLLGSSDTEWIYVFIKIQSPSVNNRPPWLS